jgi:hypothetical protein
MRGKKDKEGELSPVAESPQQGTKPENIKSGQLGFSSTAERDRMIAQTQAKLEQAKGGSRPMSPTPQGKLQRRHQPQRIMSDSWPLPPPIPVHNDNRPGTAESAPVHNGSTRLQEGSMRMGKETPEVGRGGKKKRFMMLRKAFGLKD